MIETYSTQDLWLGSFFLSETEAELTRVQTGVTGRNTVTFSFQGEDLSALADMYHRQDALANVTQMREKINFLRDILFKARESKEIAV